MKIQVDTECHNEFSHFVNKTLTKMLSPFMGICQEIGYLKRSHSDPRLITIGGGLTGVHMLLNREDPGKGGYHIGGMGFFHSEAMIKTLAETAERYSQLMSEFFLKNRVERRFESYNNMEKNTFFIPKESELSFFTESQFSKARFPFQPFDRNKPMTWVKTNSLCSKQEMWIPAQLIFIGYSIQKDEPWLLSAVTTGTAAHTNYEKALIGAISELIQIDTAMGHWYTDTKAQEIIIDERLAFFNSILKKVTNHNSTKPLFFLLPTPDLVGFTVACLFKRSSPSVPRYAIGLGFDFSLENAMYKAYMEGSGVVGLARLNAFKDKFSGNESHNSQGIYDLDTNTTHYALGQYEKIIEEKFFRVPSIAASDLQNDLEFENDNECLSFLLQLLKKTNKELIHFDLTLPEVKNLGFHVARVWSKDLLSLCLPSAIPVNHPRFEIYRGVTHDFPHPYP